MVQSNSWQKWWSVVLIGLVGCSFLSCEEGLSPGEAHRYGIRGLVTFRHWPPQDSVVDLRIAALQRYPVANIAGEVIAGRARYSDQLPYGVDSIRYTLDFNPLPPGTIPFVGVAQRYGSDLQKDWRIVGEYYAQGDTTKPGTVIVPGDSIIGNIDMVVDFSHLPPQP